MPRRFSRVVLGGAFLFFGVGLQAQVSLPAYEVNVMPLR